jgi:hypothetical protein
MDPPFIAWDLTQCLTILTSQVSPVASAAQVDLDSLVSVRLGRTTEEASPRT